MSVVLGPAWPVKSCKSIISDPRSLAVVSAVRRSECTVDVGIEAKGLDVAADATTRTCKPDRGVASCFASLARATPVKGVDLG